jgi:transcriptional regulator GlxA family with amidase domain
MNQPRQIVFTLFPQLTQLDFTGPFEVLRRWPGATVTVASSAGGRLESDGGLVFADLAKLSDIPHCDLLCVPGGGDLAGALGDAEFLSQLRRLADSATHVTSVCTGSLLLAAAGLLHGKRAACHWAYRELLAELGARPDPGRVVRDGRFITGGGVTAGIDFALTLLAELESPETAAVVQLALEYDPKPPLSAGRPETAPAPVTQLVQSRVRARLPALRAALLRAQGRTAELAGQ